MFEAVHGAAPDIAGQNIANPTAMILSAIMMCRYIDLGDVADTIEHALAKTFDDGTMTVDLNRTTGVSTTEFTEAIIHNLGHESNGFTPSSFTPIKMPSINALLTNKGQCIGVDIVIVSNESVDQLKATLNRMADEHGFQHVRLSNRGKEITANETNQIIPQWFCRFESRNGHCDNAKITTLISTVATQYHWVQIEKLCTF